MKFASLRIQRNSIRYKLLVGILAVVVPLIVLLLYMNINAINVVHRQVADSNKNMLSLYMRLMDKGLEETNQYLLSLATTEYNMDILVDPQATSDEYALAKIYVFNKLQKEIINYTSIDSLFVYTLPNKDWIHIEREEGGLESQTHIEAIQTYMMNTFIGAYTPPDGWYPQKIGDAYYVFHVLRAGDLFIGAWVKAESLLTPLTFIHTGGHGVATLATESGQPMTNIESLHNDKVDLSRDLNSFYLTGKNDKYLVVGEQSKLGNFRLMAVIQDKAISENLPYLNKLVYVIIALGVLIIPVFFLFLRKTVMSPINRIIHVMKRIGDGNVNVRIPAIAASDEFMLMNQTFNKMMSQIEELKIDVYEERIQNQRMELQHLQLQINPHFFLNSLNIIFNFAQERNFELIREMSGSLIRYFRYMFRSNLTFVTLKEELEHVHNYIRIQKLRYPKRFLSDFDTPDALMTLPVPPLVIQSFVENTIKYAISLDRMTELSITTNLITEQDGPKLRISIQDSGPGFTDDILSKLQTGTRIGDDQGEHIGIWNVERRLRILYGDKARIEYSNIHPHGASVILFLPLKGQHERG